MSTPDRAETNRRNGQKSMEPTTDDGKIRSRLNALKHGMTAALPVIPGEDGEALQRRIDAWTDDLRPNSLLESHVIEQAAQISWQVERIETRSCGPTDHQRLECRGRRDLADGGLRRRAGRSARWANSRLTRRMTRTCS